MSADRSDARARRPRAAVRRWFVVVGVGIAAFVAAQVAVSRTDDQAEVVMVLDENEVDWPYHDAVRQTALGLLENDPAALMLLGSVGGSDATVSGDLLSGQSHFSFRVTSDDEAQASAAADALAAWLVDSSEVAQRQPLQAELDVLSARMADLRVQLDTSLAQSTEGDEAEEALATARTGELASLLAQYERSSAELETDLELVRPQLHPAGPASPVTSTLEPIATGVAGLAAAAGAFAFLRTTGERRPADDDAAADD